MMRFGGPRPLTFINARVVSAEGVSARSLRVAGGRVAELDGSPRAGDGVVDLDGAFVYPGLINAHDHLELNNFPRLKWRERHDNARDWIAGFTPRFTTDPRLIEPLKVPLDERLWQGGLKNLLSGATTVCHHNTLDPALRRRDFPVQVVRNYGWSHSLLVDGEAAVARAYHHTPGGWPWIIHAAEGTDAEAAGELSRLEQLGCLSAKTVVVHGVALASAGRARLLASGGGLIWCPSSNLFMLAATADVRELAKAGRVALGSDSRLSGGRDILDELKAAAAAELLGAAALFRLVTTDAARLLRLPQAGRLEPGLPADLLVLPAQRDDPYDNLIASERSSVSLVMIGGQAQFGDRALIPQVLGSPGDAANVVLDDRPKWLRRSLAEQCWTNRAQEPGLVRDGSGAEAGSKLGSGARS